MDQNRARAGCKEKTGGCMSGCAGKREQKGVRDCRGGLIGVSVFADPDPYPNPDLFGILKVRSRRVI